LGKEQGILHRRTFYSWSYRKSQWDPFPDPRCHPLHRPIHPGLLGLLGTRNHDADVSIISLRTIDVDGLRVIVPARHGQNGLVQHRSSVGGTQCEPLAKIAQPKESPTERMRRTYSCAVDVEVKNKTGHLKHLVENSLHFRPMNVREARSRRLPGWRLRMSRYVNGLNPWVNFRKIRHSKGFKLPEISSIAQRFRSKNGGI
jgi:hypothetical protein